MSTPAPFDPRALCDTLPRGLYLLTAAHENQRAGQIVHWVQPCAIEPALVCVAAYKGHTIEPLIRDSHVFGLCAVDAEDKLIMRKFAAQVPPDESGDPFDSLDVVRLATGAPILRRSGFVLDCEVVRHFDLEADHEIYVGLVRAGRAEPGWRS